MIDKLDCIMLIDDDEPTNFFNQMIVEESGCTDHIKVAESGQQALDYLSNSSNTPSLIFLDINMPAMNGWEFLENYKKLNKERKSEIVIVMLTTSLFPEDLLKAREISEISGFEYKPLTAEKLNTLLKKHFDNTYSI